MTYTPHEWQDEEIITAEKLNAIEQGISNNNSYDAEILIYHDDNSGHDTEYSIISGNYIKLFELLTNNIAPNILVRVYDELNHIRGASNATAVYIINDEASIPYIIFCTQIPNTSSANNISHFIAYYFCWDIEDNIGNW